MDVLGGDTNITTYFALRLAADGTAATGLTITNFDLQYVRSGAAPSAKVDATALAAADTAHTDNYAIEVDATDQPGLYRVDWPDAAFAAGAREVVLSVKCATCFTEHLRVQIDPPVGAAASVTGAVGSVTGEVTADAVKINSNATAAANLALSALGIIGGIAQTGTLSTTQMTTDLTGYADDELIGRVVVFTGGTANGQATSITDYASASGLVTYETITTAPANLDAFVLV